MTSFDEKKFQIKAYEEGKAYAEHSLLGAFSLPYLTKYLFEITQTLTQNAKWAKKDDFLVCFLNFFQINVEQLLLLLSKFCDTELK